MKKTIITVSMLAAGVLASFGQGTIAVYSIASGYANYTDPANYVSADNGAYVTTGTGVAKTASTAGAYYYALLVQPYTGSISTINPLDSNWAVGMMGTNFSTGGIKGAGGSAGAAVTGLSTPGAAYNTTVAGTEDYFLLVGWSSNLGTSWTGTGGVQSQLSSGNWAAQGYFGTSALGYAYGGGGANSLPAPSIYGVTTGAPGGLTAGVTLYATPTPEPSTIALAGMGIASLVALRRRNK